MLRSRVDGKIKARRRSERHASLATCALPCPPPAYLMLTCMCLYPFVSTLLLRLRVCVCACVRVRVRVRARARGSRSVVAPFNPLSVYEHMTSPSAALHPPAWVRHDYQGGTGGAAMGGPGGGNQMPGPREVGTHKEGGGGGKGHESLDSMWQTAQGGIPLPPSPGPCTRY